jgi:hypothetical protein
LPFSSAPSRSSAAARIALRAQAEIELRARGSAGGARAVPLPGETWQDWLTRLFPRYVRGGFAPRHADLWGWVWGLSLGRRAPAFVGIWPRGGAKSTSAELSVCAVAARQSRRYALYVSETQELADKHVQSVAGLMEAGGFDRAVNKFGSSKGWRRNQLRTADGFKVDAIGLDTAARGIKVGEDRPDYIIVDDVDGKHDTPQATRKKIEAITMTLLPAMAPAGVVLAVQNLIHAHSIFTRMTDGRATYLMDRIVSGPHPAVAGLEVAEVDGRPRIVAGTPTWGGQDLEACQHYIDTWGLPAFLAEAQHKVAVGGKYFTTFDPLVHVGPAPYPYPADAIFWAYLDYGWTHNQAFGVLMRTGERTYLLGEHVANQTSVAGHDKAMHALLARLRVRRDWLAYIVAGGDVFSTDRNGRTIAMDYADRGWGLSRADNDRVNGWAAVRELLGDPAKGVPARLIIDPSCVRTIEALDTMVRDPKRPEDVLKVDSNEHGEGGDDAADGLRYGIYTAPFPDAMEEADVVEADIERVEISPL